MVALNKLRTRAQALKGELIVIYCAYRHPRVGLLPKIIILLALGYALSPIDLIPDCIPILGYAEDLIIVPALISLALRLIPPEVRQEARQQAKKEEIRLRKIWFFALLFVAIWIALVIYFLTVLAKLLF